jgi:hypothetical protein
MFLQASDPLIHSHSSVPAPALTAEVRRCAKSKGAGGWSALFLGQMYSVEGAQRLAMRVRLQVRSPGARGFHFVHAPGLGSWHRSERSVRLFRYLAQVTDLTGPADYRALIDYRWLGPAGGVIRRAARLTPECVVPAGVAGTRRGGAAGSRSAGARPARVAARHAGGALSD